MPPVKHARTLDRVQLGVVWQVAYASVFQAPVARARLTERLVGAAASDTEVERAMRSDALRDVVCSNPERDFVFLQGQAHVLELAEERRQRTQTLLANSKEAMEFARNQSGTVLVALSGGCAHDSADDGDIDLFVVARRDAVWSTLLSFVVRSKWRGFRKLLCLNYIVDETAAEFQERDFYTAFELVSLKPLDTPASSGYARLLQSNLWASEIFPNFFRSGLVVQNPRHTVELAGRPTLLERASRMIYKTYLKNRLPKGPGIELGDRVVRLHTNDHRARLRAEFQRVLAPLGVEAPPWI